MGSKQPDSLTIPLCVKCHAIVHASGGTVIINQLWYFYQLIRSAIRNQEINPSFFYSFTIAPDDIDFLIDFAKGVRDVFASGEAALK